ncbi:hypothetical protein GALL_374430 [mine drainage metagenome]|uniref:N-acetyltransferase domain-containing protein n=1 Tax=mine drainage metagenome TaxID=410659 RepID=A0A1J5QAY0_9ZZZZ
MQKNPDDSLPDGEHRPLPVMDRTIFHFASALTKLSSEGSEPAFAPTTRFENESFKIRLVSNNERRKSAVLLVEKLYGSRGYKASNEAAAPEEKPDRITLLVNNKENRPVGTITLGPDGPMGLMADELYKDELDAMRAKPGVRLLELTKLAMDRHSGNVREVLAHLFNIVYIYTKVLECNWMVIEVNPRHVGFYESSLGFKVLGAERICPRVNAPAVLLGLDLKYMAEQIKKFSSNKNVREAGKSLYRYSLSKKDELGLVKRLLEGDVHE